MFIVMAEKNLEKIKFQFFDPIKIISYFYSKIIDGEGQGHVELSHNDKQKIPNDSLTW